MMLEAAWLYDAIFAEVERVWTSVTQGDDPDRFKPESLVVMECSGADWRRIECCPPIVKAWIYDCEGERSQIPPELVDGIAALVVEEQQCHLSTRRERLYAVGASRFHITADKKYVVITHCMGPLYGAGRAWRVVRHGRAARLEPARAFGQWAA